VTEQAHVVSRLVVDVHAAAAAGMIQHLFNFLDNTEHTDDWSTIARVLDLGYDADLSDVVAPTHSLGFNHGYVSQALRSKLEPYELHKGRQKVSHHLWEMDDERGIYSLFGNSKESEETLLRANRKTRFSAVIQNCMREARTFRQANKASKRKIDLAQPTAITLPSPLYVASQMLSASDSPASKIYAKSALQEFIRFEIEKSDNEAIDISFESVSKALSLINNRRKTSKPIHSNRMSNKSTVIYLCNLFAISGIMAIRANIDTLYESYKNDQIGELIIKMLVGDKTLADCEFIVNPHFVDLPSIGEVMNLIDGLPLPIEGADTVFQGGIRSSPNNSIVAAVSGSFGVGKTLFGLSVAAALAPLGCRTLFLSCEETEQDIESRLTEAAPASLFRSAPLFAALSEGATSNTEPLKPSGSQSGSPTPWFLSRYIKLEQSTWGQGQSSIDPASALGDMLDEAMRAAAIFEPWQHSRPIPLPRFARPVIIIDGLHQLFDIEAPQQFIEASLRSLIERCRTLKAFILFSFSSESLALKRMEYLCDLIIELDKEGFTDPGETPRRFFQLLKARRQPARIGAHVFHLKGDSGFRIKASTNARVDAAKREVWWNPEEQEEIFLTNEAPPGFRSHGQDVATGRDRSSHISIHNRSQILVIGRGSAGKAAFGLYLLHRRWFNKKMLLDDLNSTQLTLPDDAFSQIYGPSGDSDDELAKSGLPVWYISPYLETRVLVISFLYQGNYYDSITRGMRIRRRRMTLVDSGSSSAHSTMGDLEFFPFPDNMLTETISLYPGMLCVEDFMSKIEKRLSEAEYMGIPYTGVLIDGLHNVFVQFPELEKESSFWGLLYDVLRRRKVTVVTTHTDFDIHGASQGGVLQEGNQNVPMTYDFEQAHRKIAPLLSALVSGADYLFDLSSKHVNKRIVYPVTPLGSINFDVGNVSFEWDRKRMRLDRTFGPTREIVTKRRAAEGSSELLSKAFHDLATQIGALSNS
jgi:hypothetical protein